MGTSSLNLSKGFTLFAIFCEWFALLATRSLELQKVRTFGVDSQRVRTSGKEAQRARTFGHGPAKNWERLKLERVCIFMHFLA